MAQEKAQLLLRLAHEMQGTAYGISIDDIMQRFSVSRRTAERMRDAVCAVFPQADYVDHGDRIRRWRIPSQPGKTTIPVTANELATLHGAAEKLRQDGRHQQASTIDGAVAKLRALMAPDVLRRVEIDYDSLVEHEGLALRPGPQLTIGNGILRDLRQAIIGSEQVILRHRSKRSGTVNEHPVYPYGFLYGNRHYLVAYHPEVRANPYRLFSLGDIESVELLGETFERDEGFNLQDYARQSFGVWRETPVDVVWRASPTVAADARSYNFHPSQTFEDQPDGSLLIRFRAGGLREMCWHLFTWGGEIQVLEPTKLVEEMRSQLRAIRKALPTTSKTPRTADMSD